MIWIKLLVPASVLVADLIRVALQEKWRKTHDGRTNLHKWTIRLLVFLMVAATLGTCAIVWWDSTESARLTTAIKGVVKQNEELLIKIENCQPPKRMGALKPRYLETPTDLNVGIAIRKHGIHTDGTQKADQQAILVDLADGDIIQPFGPNVAFSVRKTQEGLLISSIVYSLDGRVVARIIDNDWRLLDERYLDRNFDSSAIEVIDDYGVPVLQVEFFSPDTIRVGGVFRGENAPISETDSAFPSRPAGSGGSGLCRVHGGSKAVMGERGQMFGGKWPTTVAERDALTTEAKKRVVPWFDYSKPGRLGVRITTTEKDTR